ncbi:uncharacterized protein LOC117121235 [Anneissia japonica]|uniref:uncharacterized protein LOC117121235 n=1 Tax=Anneissia japonica TaxID=1529436 RepID=UPI0014257AB4|nr:uncharacterized protein LOC117121235 [Anneissia japonica]
MEEQINLVCSGLPVYRAYAKSEKVSNNLLAKHYNVADDDYSLIFLQTGSFVEGFPDVVESDVDWMVILNSPKEIITADWQDKVFMPVEHAPAHVKIQIPVADLQRFQKKCWVTSKSLGLLNAVEGEEAFISAKRARNLNKNDFRPDWMKDNKPSSPWENPENDETSPSYCLQSQEMKNVTVDRVPALQCEGWPKVAHEWIGRKRNWPAASLVEKISSGDFYIVPKPSSASGDHENEWRLSFSFAEAELLQNFGDVQVRVYYVLRTLYVKHLKERVKGTLSSYNIKTTLLYMLQDHKTDFWSEENTVAIIQTFFERLHQYLKEGFCPHYFIPKHNLLYKISRPELDKAAYEISVLIADPASALNEITEKGFLGMMPRFGFWNVEVRSRLTLKLMELPEHEAYTAITSKSASNLAFCKTIERKCFVDILHDTACAIKAFPGSDSFVNIYLPLIFRGYHMSSATEGDGSTLTFNQLKMARPDPAFMEMNVEQLNNSIYVWVELCRVALEQILRGGKTKLITHCNTAYKLLTLNKFEKDNTVVPEFKLFHKMCSIASGFLASANLNAKEIDYEQLLTVMDGSLPSIAEGCLQEKDLCEPVVFVFTGGTSQMANKLYKV